MHLILSVTKISLQNICLVCIQLLVLFTCTCISFIKVIILFSLPLLLQLVRSIYVVYLRDVVLIFIKFYTCELLFTFQVTSMDNIQICYDCLNMEDFPQSRIIFSQEIMQTEESSLLKPFVYCLLIKSNTQRTFFYYEETMNVLVSTEYMVFMMNVGIFLYVLHIFWVPNCG